MSVNPQNTASKSKKLRQILVTDLFECLPRKRKLDGVDSQSKKTAVIVQCLHHENEYCSHEKESINMNCKEHGAEHPYDSMQSEVKYITEPKRDDNLCIEEFALSAMNAGRDDKLCGGETQCHKTYANSNSDNKSGAGNFLELEQDVSEYVAEKNLSKQLKKVFPTKMKDMKIKEHCLENTNGGSEEDPRDEYERKRSGSDNSQDDDLHKLIMEDKKESNRRYLQREIVSKEDDDLSQEMPPRSPVYNNAASPAQQTRDTHVFPTQDFEETFEEEAVEVFFGKPKEELLTMPHCLLPLPDLKPLRTHTVLFDSSYFDLGPPPPSNNIYTDRWDSFHVKLPCSPKSLYPVVKNSRQHLTNRWELIEMSLLDTITNSIELERAILCYNSRFSHSFRLLHSFFNEFAGSRESQIFFSETLPKMVELCLSLPSYITEPIPLLRKQVPHVITMSQQQAACLLVNAFFCTFPRRNSTKTDSEYATYPKINFNRLFSGHTNKTKRNNAQIEKLRTLLHYFTCVTIEMPPGVITFERRVIKDFPVWNQSPCTLCELHVAKDGLIEMDGKGMSQIDFANKYVGGGVLGYGMVQEEIRFCICPELIVSMLFTEELDNNECLVVSGIEQYSAYSGYAGSYKWEGNYVDTNTRDSWRRKTTQVIAIDAKPFHRSTEQYRPGHVRRELNKLYTGFYCDDDPDFSPAIATGNWGCGAFGGDPVFKALLQMMAAAVVGRDLCYFTFNDVLLTNMIHSMHQFIKDANYTVGDLWGIILKYNEETKRTLDPSESCDENIFEFMQRLYNDYQVSTDDESQNSPETMG